MIAFRSAAVRGASAAIALLAGCYGGKPSDFGEGNGGLPDGVLRSARAEQQSGIFEAGSDSGETCCWLAKEATFRVHVLPSSRRIRLTVLLPDSGPFKTRPIDERVSIDGGPSKTFARLSSGIYDLHVEIGGPPREHDAQVRMVASYDWTGIEEHINGDGRRLTVQLEDAKPE